MSNYVKSTNFAIKDGLSTSDPAKVIKGTEIDNEYNAISSAIGSKADVNSPALTGTPTTPTATPGTNTTQIASTAFIKAALDVLLPTGVICMWSGAISAIPTGWKLCDGSNSTPDLRGKFVIGAGDTAASITAKAGASVTGSISGTTLTVTSVSSGSLIVNQVLTGNSATSGTKITSQLSGVEGKEGTYTVSISQTRSSGSFTGTYTLASTTLSILSTKMTVTAVASGSLSIGQFLTGTGVAYSTTITAFGTGSGNTGTYTLSSAQYFASTTVSASAGTVTVGAVGGSKDASVISHTHAAIINDPGHLHSLSPPVLAGPASRDTGPSGAYVAGTTITQTQSATTGITVSNSNTGVSGTNANLPPYYALAYIMKS